MLRLSGGVSSQPTTPVQGGQKPVAQTWEPQPSSKAAGQHGFVQLKERRCDFHGALEVPVIELGTNGRWSRSMPDHVRRVEMVHVQVHVPSGKVSLWAAAAEL